MTNSSYTTAPSGPTSTANVLLEHDRVHATPPAPIITAARAAAARQVSTVTRSRTGAVTHAENSTATNPELTDCFNQATLFD